jgi:hypothetical protein
MADTYLIHTFYNQDEYVAILNAVVMVCGGTSNDTGFTMLVKTVAIIGLMSVMLFGIWRARGEDAVSYVIAFAIIYSCLFLPRVTVIVQDHGYETTPRVPQPVANVPIGLAFFATATSRIGYWLTNQFEAVFSMPDGMSYRKSGLMGGSRILRSVANAKVSPMLAHDLSNFMMYCVNPEILVAETQGTASSGLTMQKLLKMKNIWNEIRPYLNPGRVVSLKKKDAIMQCVVEGDEHTTGWQHRSAYAYLTNEIAGETIAEAGRISRELYPGEVESVNPMLLSVLPQIEAYIYNGSSSAITSIRQGMVINMLNTLGSNMGQALNDPSTVMTAVGSAQAASNANASFRISAELARQSLPLIHNIIELIIIAIFPVVFLIMVAAGPKVGFVIRNYVVAMLWVQLWAPIYAVVNYIGMLNVARNMRVVVGDPQGLVISNAATIQETLISGEAVAGMMTGLVVVISFAILKGGEVAMSGMVQSISRPADSAAQQAGSQVGSGNIQMGNVNWGNVTAYNTSGFQTKTAGSSDSGYFRKTDQYGSIDYRQDGTPGNANIRTSDMGIGINRSERLGRTNTDFSGSGVRGSDTTRSGEEGSYGTKWNNMDSAQQQATLTQILDNIKQITNGGDSTESVTTGGRQGNAAGVTEKTGSQTTTVVGIQTPGGGGRTPSGGTGSEGVPASGSAPADQAERPGSSYNAGIPEPEKGRFEKAKEFGNNAASAVGNSLGKLMSFVKLGVSQQRITSEDGEQKWTAENSTQVQKQFNDLEKAVENFNSGTQDHRVKTALHSNMAELARGLNATYGTSISLDKYQEAGERRELSRSAEIAKIMNDNELLFQKLTNKGGEYEGRVGQLNYDRIHNPAKVEAAVGKAYDKEANPNNYAFGQQMYDPIPQQDVESNFRDHQAVHQEQAIQNVGAEHKANALDVAGRQHAGANSKLDTSKFDKDYDALLGKFDKNSNTYKGLHALNSAATRLSENYLKNDESYNSFLPDATVGERRMMAIGLAMEDKTAADIIARISSGGEVTESDRLYFDSHMTMDNRDRFAKSVSATFARYSDKAGDVLNEFVEVGGGLKYQATEQFKENLDAAENLINRLATTYAK